MTKDIKLSNIKGLLIFLVVFGHLLAPYQDYYNGLYLFIYSFHMPLFVLVSGYFAKRASYKKVANFILLYLIFQLLYQSFLVLIKQGHVFNVEYNDPYYHLWYLVSMAAWYLLAIGVKKTPLRNINKAVLVFGCFIIGIISRYITPFLVTWMHHYYSKFDSYTLSYQRTLSFMPFFFLGMYLTEENMHKLYQGLKNKRLIPVIAICGTLAYTTFTDSTDLENIFKGSYGVDEMKGELLSTSGEIVIGYLIAIIMCYILLNLISSKKSILTKWGDRTLPIFLFHIFFTRIIKDFDFLDGLNHFVLLSLLFITTVIIVCILSTDTFMDLTYNIWHPYKSIKVIVQKLRPAI